MGQKTDMTLAQKTPSPVRRRRRVAPAPQAARLSLAGLMDEAGALRIDELTELLRMTRAQIAETAGLPSESLQKKARRESPKAQTRVREMLEIINLVQAWAGGPAQAMAWYRAEPIPAFGGRTAEALVKSGAAAAVRDYVDHLATGGYA